MAYDTATIAPPRTLTELAALVRAVAARPDDWIERIQLRSDERWFECVECGADYDVWVISWLPGQATGFHDHGESSGAFAVAFGTLEEHRAGVDPLTVGFGEARAFGPRYAHDVRNASTAPAISVHAYSPRLTRMNKYELAGERLVPLTGKAEARPQVSAPPIAMGGADDPPTAPGPRERRTIGEVLEAARARLQRLSPEEAQQAADRGAMLVDIRPAAQRAAEGETPAAIIVDRNVLEWRFDPRSEARLPAATGYDLQVIIMCSEGYTSSLAAAALQDLGLSHATDVIGGFQAWRRAGLPTMPSRSREREAAPLSIPARVE